ncbi:hypothetical protein [Nocardia sp. XZ_19_369]|uniref:hypothetical protein n=1 Tax=Nocardia sp. XZ_19_369 TaxID=2769487 RepID=UPI00188F68A7|nr:hypothetical protein [Nocardia sp. XZ_19_369]
MALLIYYNQLRDDPSEVEYEFGGDRENLDRTLIIDKAHETVRTDQAEDGIFRAAAGRIIGQAHREKSWPQSGVIAS